MDVWLSSEPPSSSNQPLPYCCNVKHWEKKSIFQKPHKLQESQGFQADNLYDEIIYQNGTTLESNYINPICFPL